MIKIEKHIKLISKSTLFAFLVLFFTTALHYHNISIKTVQGYFSSEDSNNANEGEYLNCQVIHYFANSPYLNVDLEEVIFAYSSSSIFKDFNLTQFEIGIQLHKNLRAPPTC